jgi:hypothetical protein
MAEKFSLMASASISKGFDSMSKKQMTSSDKKLVICMVTGFSLIALGLFGLWLGIQYSGWSIFGGLVVLYNAA